MKIELTMKRNRAYFWLFLAAGLMLASCTKNDDSTIALIGTEYYIKDILSVIPDSLQTKFFANFGSIPEGPVPPKIGGSYRMNPKRRVANNAGLPVPADEPPMFLRFSSQHNGVVAIDLNDPTETFTDTVFIQGNGQDFAVYFIEDKVIENFSVPVKMKRGVIMKGRVTDAGLADFCYATIVLGKEDELNQLANPGSYYIYKDGDGNAERFDW